MSMSTSIVGFRPPDEQWEKMKRVYESCVAAGVQIPADVDKFFDYDPPGTRPGAEVDIEPAVTRFNEQYRDGFQIDLSKLPKDVRFIRVVNSY